MLNTYWILLAIGLMSFPYNQIEPLTSTFATSNQHGIEKINLQVDTEQQVARFLVATPKLSKVGVSSKKTPSIISLTPMDATVVYPRLIESSKGRLVIIIMLILGIMFIVRALIMLKEIK